MTKEDEDLCKAHDIDPAELVALKEFFHEVDDSHTGHLTRDDMKNMLV
jgi:Ca2+-binding EF-hand superfamily protein